MSVVRKGGRDMRRMGLMALAGLVAIGLGGCVLDKEDGLRDELAQWLDLSQTLEFSSTSTCTAAVFLLETTKISERLTKVNTIDTAVHYLTAGRPVVFDIWETSPNMVSEQIMTAHLEHGLGLLSSGLGPAQRCLSDRAGLAFYNAIMATDAALIYDPEGNSLTLIHVQSEIPLAIFLRGNV